jgi:hypothetical protein
MQKIFVVVALACIAGAAAFSPSTLPLRLKGSALHGNMHLARSRKVTPQKTMALQAAPAASAALGAMQVHFATSQILVWLFDKTLSDAKLLMQLSRDSYFY